MKDFKTFIAVMLLSSLGLNNASAALPVYDSSNLANAIERFQALKEQLKFLQKELDVVQSQYRALTGTRNLGKAAYNSKINKFLPEEHSSIYNTANDDLGISAMIKEIENMEKMQGSASDMKKSIKKRNKNRIHYNKAMSSKGYEGSKCRLAQIESLMEKINETEDPKAISELNARINLEQAILQNESNKLKLISQLQKAEADLIEAQKDELGNRILKRKKH